MTKEQKIRKAIKQIVDKIPKEDIENRVKQDEQEEAIKRCEQLIKPEHTNWIGISNQEAIRELLNMLKEKDEEIEFQKDINKIEKDRHKKTEKSLKGQIIKNNKIIEKLEKEAQGYFEENIKKDKITDLMAETIRKLAILLANYRCSYNEETIHFTVNIKDIEQYFEQKSDK